MLGRCVGVVPACVGGSGGGVGNIVESLGGGISGGSGGVGVTHSLGGGSGGVSVGIIGVA